MQWAGHQFVFLLSDAAPSKDQSDVAYHLIERNITLALHASGSKFGPVSIAANGSTHALVIVKQGNKVTATVNGKQVADSTLAPTATSPIRVLPEGTLTTGTDTFELVGDELRLREDADIAAAQSGFPITIRCAWSPVIETAYSITPASRLAELIEYKATDFTKGLVAYYPFNGNAKDESGNGNDGSVNGATLSADRHRQPGRSYAFDGKTSFANMGNREAFNFGQSDFSFSIWIMPRGRNVAKYVISKYQPLNKPAYGIGTGQRGNAYAWIGFPDSAAFIRAPDPLIESQWHHLVVLVNRKGAMQLFTDGSLISSVDISKNGGTISNDIALSIGQVEGNGTTEPFRRFSGQLDDIRIYNRALSAEEVKALYEFEKAD
jgi:hypothetical protein